MNWIKELKPSQIFCFGSNLSGRHGGGAARQAIQWGAVLGQAEGLQGQTYAIPTVGFNIERTLEIREIKPYVDRFIEFAISHPELEFLVTPIGTGLAGIETKDIAPLFENAIGVKNIVLPEEFVRELF